MTVWRSPAVVVGKAAWHPEYLRPRAAPAELLAFDEWLFRNAQAGSPEPSAEESYGFLIRVGGTEPSTDRVAGVIAPSADRAGRAYPLAVVSSVAISNDVFQRPEVTPILLESFWESALEALSRVKVDPAERDREDLGGITSEPIGAFSEALDLYTSWTQQTSTADVCGLLERSIEWLDTTCVALRGILAQGPSVSPVRLPLGGGGGAVLCLWLDVWRRASRGAGGIPSFFWSNRSGIGEALLFPGPLDDAALAALWGEPTGGAPVRDLTPEPGPQAPFESPAGESGLDRAQLALATFLEQEGRAAGW